MKRFFVAAVLVMAVLLVFVSCRRDGRRDGPIVVREGIIAEGLLNFGEPATIRFAWWGADPRHNAILEAISIFESRYPNITVEPQFGAFGGYLDSLTVQLAGRAEADVIQVNYAWVHSLGAGRNVFANLRDLACIIDLSEWSDDLLAFTTTADGQLGGVPHGITGRVIIYNTELLAQYGFSTFPETFDELAELGQRVAAGNTTLDAGNNTYAFFPVGNESWDIIMLTMLYNETGRNLQENRRILFTVDEVERMFDVWDGLITNGTLPTFQQQEIPLDTTNPVWMQGRGGSLFEWVGNIFLAGGNFRDNNPAVRRVEGLGIALLPSVTLGAPRNSMQRPSMVHTISRNSANPEIAAYFLNFLYTDPEALTVLGAQFGVPLSRTAALIAERDGHVWGLMAEGLDLLTANMGIMCPMFENTSLRAHRFHAIEAFRTGSATARQAAEMWVNNQQLALNEMR